MSPEEIAQQRRERDQARSDARRALDQALRTAEENPNSHDAQVKVDGAKMVLQHAEEAYRGHLSQHSPSEVADYDAAQYRAARRPMRPIDNIQEQVRSNPAPEHRPTGNADEGYLPAEARPIEGVSRNPAPQDGLTPTPAPEAGLESAWRGWTSQPRSSSQEVSPTSPVPFTPQSVDGIGRNPAPEGGLPATPAPEAGLASAWRGLMTPPASQPAAPTASPTGSQP